MVASAAADVVGTAPISFTGSTGAQKPVPLSALKFSGSKPDVADDWATEFKPADNRRGSQSGPSGGGDRGCAMPVAQLHRPYENDPIQPDQARVRLSRR